VERDELLSRAFALAAEARSVGDHPFGALLEIGGEIVAEARNRVNRDRDITAHAETQLVRILEAEGRLGELSAGTVYASCEPCPMCVGAMFWSGVRRVVFGLSAARLRTLSTPPGRMSFGFEITANEIAERCTPPMEFIGPQREDEAAEAHRGFWV
jgi:tRNA(Arg) A34 adenosine deaminase TadA